jgi:hypothetical protein
LRRKWVENIETEVMYERNGVWASGLDPADSRVEQCRSLEKAAISSVLRNGRSWTDERPSAS